MCLHGDSADGVMYGGCEREELDTYMRRKDLPGGEYLWAR